MAVFRVAKTKDYTVMSNYHLKDRRLSLKAKGLLTVMLSLPDSWNYTLHGLTAINQEGVDAIREAVRELEQAGYIVRTRARNAQGQLKGTVYTIYEQPQQPESQLQAATEQTPSEPVPATPAQETPALENPTQASPALAYPTQSNTYLSKKQSEKERKKEHTNGTNPHPSVSVFIQQRAAVEELRETVRQNICYDYIVTPTNREQLDEMVELMVETLSTQKEMIKIAGDMYPAELVKERLRAINSSHVEYIFACLKQNVSHIRNIKGYLLAALFNAPATISSYYDALIRHNRSKPYHV